MNKPNKDNPDCKERRRTRGLRVGSDSDALRLLLLPGLLVQMEVGKVVVVLRNTQAYPSINIQQQSASTKLLLEMHDPRAEFVYHAVSSQNIDSQNWTLRISNPGTVAYDHFNMPFEGSNLPGAGPIFPD